MIMYYRISSRTIIKIIIISIVSLSFFSIDVNAAGFRLPELSISGVGASNALVANPKDAGAIPYNPAAMTFYEGTNYSIRASFYSL